ERATVSAYSGAQYQGVSQRGFPVFLHNHPYSEGEPQRRLKDRNGRQRRLGKALRENAHQRSALGHGKRLGKEARYEQARAADADRRRQFSGCRRIRCAATADIRERTSRLPQSARGDQRAAPKPRPPRRRRRWRAGHMPQYGGFAPRSLVTLFENPMFPAFPAIAPRW